MRPGAQKPESETRLVIQIKLCAVLCKCSTGQLTWRESDVNDW